MPRSVCAIDRAIDDPGCHVGRYMYAPYSGSSLTLYCAGPYDGVVLYDIDIIGIRLVDEAIGDVRILSEIIVILRVHRQVVHLCAS